MTQEEIGNLKRIAGEMRGEVPPVMKTDKIEKQTKGNLKPGNPAWVKGVSGNPAGRKPKVNTLKNCIEEELAKQPYEGSPVTNEQLIAAILVRGATGGNPKLLDLLLQYSLAKPPAGLDANVNLKSDWVVLHQLARGDDAPKE